jgi:hypothetical protein
MGRGHVRDDAGGVWIITGWVLGFLVYAGVLLAWHAGFSAATFFVVIPPLLIIMIGAGNLISGRRAGRPAPRFNRPDPVPVATLRGDPEVTPAGDGSDGSPGGGPGPRR